MRFFNNQKIKRGIVIPLILWLMIWAGYNTSPQKLDFSNFLNLFHGIRAFFPFLAAILALIIFLKQRSISLKIFETPLGFLAIYTLIGIFSSILLSANPIRALYWASLYGSVLIVLWVISIHSKPLSSITWLINLNWLVVGFVMLFFLALYLAQSGVISSIVNFNFFGTRPYGELAGAEKTIIGMAITRPTGFGRYTGVVAIFALARTILTKERKKFLWYFLFLISFSILIFSQARTEILGFVFGFFLIFLLKSESRVSIFGWSFFTLFQLVLVGLFLFYIPFFYTPHLLERIVIPEPGIVTLKPSIPAPSVPTHEPSLMEKITPVSTLSGRTIGVWPQAWKLFLESPLIGWGFHADRIFLAGQHAHNAILHALIQTGIIGTVPFLIAFVWAWVILFKLLKNPYLTEKPFLIEIAGVMAFFMIRSITESTGAFFGVDWLIFAPLLAYIQNLNQKYLSNL